MPRRASERRLASRDVAGSKTADEERWGEMQEALARCRRSLSRSRRVARKR
jgi:hypothetical protein